MAMRVDLIIAVLVLAGAAHADPGDLIAKLLPDDGAIGDHFGRSVAITGDWALVGAPWKPNGIRAGAAYLFDVTTGEQLAKLVPDDAAEDDTFGSAVAIDIDRAIIGAPEDGDNGIWSGSAYLFDVSDPASPLQIAKLLPVDGAEGDFFGRSVDISGSVAIVGSADYDNDNRGAAYLFDATTGVQLAKFVPDDIEAGVEFGYSVAIDGSIVVIGAISDNDNGPGSGSAYVFDVSDPAGPVQLAKLLPDDGDALDHFGWSVAIDAHTAVIGAVPDPNDEDLFGSAYVFDLTDPADPVQTHKLMAQDGVEHDLFGISVAVSQIKIIVGASEGDGNVVHSGAAYLFDAATGEQLAKLEAGEGDEGDEFGFDVAINGATALVGAEEDQDNGQESGSAYLLDAGACPADVNGDGNLNILDFVTFQLLWQAQDPAADCDANAEFNIVDFVCFQQLFVEGCD